jgi:hypothetical protein
VVISLESRAALAFCQNDGSVKNLVKLGKVEPPTPPRKAFVPQPSNVSCRRQSIVVKADEAVPVIPLVRLWVIRGCAAESTRTIDLAESVNGTDECVVVGVVRQRPLESVEHSITSDCRVYREKDVVQDNKCLEGLGLADSPRFIPIPAVVCIQRDNRRRVDGCNRQRDFVRQSSVEDVCRNGKWRPKGGPVIGRRKRGWLGLRGKLEYSP